MNQNEIVLEDVNDNDEGAKKKKSAKERAFEEAERAR